VAKNTLKRLPSSVYWQGLSVWGIRSFEYLLGTLSLTVIRTASPQEARFAAEAVWQGGIPIVEITMTIPQALDVISELVKTMPQLLVGAGT
jgi:2-keto-3-deoxy-6-phosphogluconate aldolase